nr:MAG TPA: hypothetical protein [Caudoviricetes sp.]
MIKPCCHKDVFRLFTIIQKRGLRPFFILHHQSCDYLRYKPHILIKHNANSGFVT